MFHAPQAWLTHLEAKFGRYFRDRFSGTIHAYHNPSEGFANTVSLVSNEKVDGKLLAKVTAARDFQSLAPMGAP